MSSTHAGGPPVGAPTSVGTPLRLVLLSTPRAGNNWLRYLLCQTFDLPAKAVPSPDDVDWNALPPDFLLALHWHPAPSFLARLREHRFRPLVLARHPLDVLVSVLHFARHYADDPATLRWLEGEGGDERPIYSAMPRSTALLNYATGPRFRALLSVSHEWWHVPGVLRVRYEDLLRDPEAELLRLAAEFGVGPRKPVAEAVKATTIPKLRELTGSKPHFWQGKSGHWRSLLTAAEARPIAAAHAAVFPDLGYVCDPDPALDAARADANWINLVWPELADSGPTDNEAGARRRLREVDAAYHNVVKELHVTSARLREVEALYQASQRALMPFLRLSPGAARLARKLQRLARRYPRVLQWIKWISRRGGAEDSRSAA